MVGSLKGVIGTLMGVSSLGPKGGCLYLEHIEYQLSYNYFLYFGIHRRLIMPPLFLEPLSLYHKRISCLPPSSKAGVLHCNCPVFKKILTYTDRVVSIDILFYCKGSKLKCKS